MPTYTYECEACKHEWDVWGVSVKDMPPVTNCPNCVKMCVRRTMSAPKIHFHHTDKEVRIPSKSTSVYIRRDK